MNVLLSVASFSPDYGGPALSVSRLGAALLSTGSVSKVGLWAPDGSAMNSRIVDEVYTPDIETCFLRCPSSLEDAIEMMGKIDVLHDNGIWLPHNRAIKAHSVKAGIPRVVSTRGMLEPWARRYKRFKKQIAWSLYQKADLQCASALHATADEEAGNLTSLGLTTPIVVAPNGVDLPKQVTHLSRPDGLQSLLFLSRVHPKKGLMLLVESIADLKPPGWKVVIAGPDELGYTEQVRTKASKLGVDHFFEFVGPQYGDAKNKLLGEADLFVLPTHSENFGIVIAEALAHEIPVLTTTGTPWEVLHERDCGWWIEPEKNALTHALASAIALSSENRKAMGRRGRALVSETLSWDEIARKLLDCYTDVCPNASIRNSE